MPRLYALAALLVWALPAVAQTGAIEGRVLDDATGEGVPGATVSIPELRLGAATQVDGTYRLADVPSGTHTVAVRLLGYRTLSGVVTVEAGETARFDATLSEDVLEFDQVVVTGQGASVERRQMTTDVEVIGLRDIELAPATSVDQVLQGRVPGATIRAVSGQPGQAAQINLRGITSVFGATTPVVYVDGVRVDNAEATGIGTGGEVTSALAELLASDIERIEVTKGGAGSTLYGSDAANGVIQVFTRRGVAGRAQVSVRTEQGVDVPELRYLKDTGFSFAGRVGDPADSAFFGKADFLRDNYFRTGYAQSYSVGASGGRDGLTFALSGRLQDGQGVQPDNESAVYALRGSVAAALSPRVTAEFSGAYTHTRFRRLFAGRALQDPLTSFEVGDALTLTGTRTLEDALAVFLSTDVDEGVDRFTVASTVRHTAGPRFDQRLTVGVDVRANEQRITEPLDYPVVASRQGRLDRYNRDFTSVTLEYAATARTPLDRPVSGVATFGAQGFRTDESVVSVFAENFSLPGFGEFDDAGLIDATETQVELFNGGVFGQATLGLGNRLFLDVGGRLDGNSAFGSDVGLQAYPKLGLAYTASDEPFWAGTFGRAWSNLKLRAAYGETGKFPRPFARDRTFGAVPFLGESAASFSNPGDPDLGPERTATLEGGFDAAFLGDRLGVTMTAYQSRTTDALFFVPEQPVTGLGFQLRNVGTIRNRGLEATLRVRPVQTAAVTWDVSGYVHTFANKVTEAAVAPFGVGAPITPGGDGVQYVEEGRAIGEWFLTRAIDTDGDGRLDASERAYVGGTPYFSETGGLRSELRLFNRWTLSALADFGLGARVLDLSARWSALNGLERVELPVRFPTAAAIEAGVAAGTFVVLEGDVFQAVGGEPVLDAEGRPVSAGRAFGVANAEEALLQDGDYLKLRELSVRYLVPVALARRVGLYSATVYASARNLVTWSASDLVDPELSGIGGSEDLQLGGVTGNTLSPPRQFRLGLLVTL